MLIILVTSVDVPVPNRINLLDYVLRSWFLCRWWGYATWFDCYVILLPKGKGAITGAFYTAGSIASFTIPLFTGMMASNLANIFLFDVVIALIGFVLAVLITIRYRHLFKSDKGAAEIGKANS